MEWSEIMNELNTNEIFKDGGEVVFQDPNKREWPTPYDLSPTIEDLPTVPHGEPLNFKATDTEVHFPVVEVVEGPVQPLDVLVEEEVARNTPTVDPIEVLYTKLKAATPSVPTGKRGRPTQYDLHALEVGASLEYPGTLNAGRVLASLKGKGTDMKFKATGNDGNIVITRMK